MTMKGTREAPHQVGMRRAAKQAEQKSKKKAEVDQDVAALGKILDALEDCSTEQRERILRTAAAFYGLPGALR